ncbi:hypothetical protein [Spirosoma linguale]|uniref:Uncharacterized protein n=1 Tax=Spirosoma linguale (strain ATCC 33905 / DSM 74 / LMG 10896 / Claus 1) TaxID=504472 RepID=D2QIS4_SPILD|nr:hypothetical protein Slin_4010 [Spirosoma linguale DSM 74]
MRRILLVFFYILSIQTVSFSQELVEVLSETFTANSITSMSGSTRNVAEVQLPRGSIGYTYRISVFKRGRVSIGNGLLSLLQSVPMSQLTIGANLAQYALSQNDGTQIDYFIFTTPDDKNAFYRKVDGNWSSCRSFLNRVNTCSHSDKCINETIWFGFRNNNMSQGLDIHLEVVAIVNQDNTDETYSFKITNGALQDVNFQLSADNQNWQECSLRSNYEGTWRFKQSYAYFKLTTQGKGTVNYRINNNERYKITLNRNTLSFDLNKY